MRTLRNLSMALLAITALATSTSANSIGECDRVGTDMGWHPGQQAALEACQDMIGSNPAAFCDDACSYNAYVGGHCADWIYSQQEVEDCHLEQLPLDYWIFGAHCQCAPDEYVYGR